MKNLGLFAPSIILAVSLALAGSLRAQSVEDEDAGIVRHRLNPRYGGAPPSGSSTATSPIFYNGGPLITGSSTRPGTTVYVIWYGNWNRNNNTDTPSGQAIILDFLQGVGGSEYFAINTTYDVAGFSIPGTVTFGGQTSVGYLYGSRLSDSRVQSTVSTVISRGGLPNDPNGVYFVLSSSDVSESSGFCTRYCGWHTHGSISGSDIKYAFVGNAARCITACAIQSTSPNNNAGVDGMVSVIAHELEEATTDPDLNAWFDASGAENADKCAWTFGHSLQQAANGSYYNITLNSLTGTRNYLIQRNLAHNVTVNTVTGDYCAMTYVGGSISQ